MTPKPTYRCESRKCQVSVFKLFTVTAQTSIVILVYCLSYSSGGYFENVLLPQKPLNTYIGCDSGCLHPNMSVQQLLKGRRVSGNLYFEDDTKVIPEWTNLTLFKIGQKFAQENVGFLGMSHLFALIFDNFMPDVKDILLATGTTSSAEGSAKRFTATAAQVVLWYQNSLDDPQQRQVLLNSLRQVRKRHNDAAFKVLRKLEDKNFLARYRKQLAFELQQDKHSIYNDLRFWSAFQADLQQSQVPHTKRKYPPYTFEGIPISQFSHAMTQFSFAGMAVLFRRQLGMIRSTEEEFRGYIHFWGVIGHALGVLDEYNICMQGSLEDSTQLYRAIMDKIVTPALFQMDQTSHIQISAYLDGLLIMNPMLTPGLMAYRFLRDIAQVKPVRMQQQLNIIERFYIAGLDGVVSDNLMFNKWFVNSNGGFFVDVNGYKYFGGNYTTNEKRSQGVFYTREKVTF